MDFDFPEELDQLRETARAFLAQNSPPSTVRAIVDDSAAFPHELWRSIAELGWLSSTIPEKFGGAELGYLSACVLAEEMGRALAPVPFSSSVYLATEALIRFASPAQQQCYLPALANGARIGTFAFVENPGPFEAKRLQVRFVNGRLNGSKQVVADAQGADLFIVAAVASNGEVGLVLVDSRDSSVQVTPTPTIDPSRPHATVSFDNTAAEPLPNTSGSESIDRLLDRAASLIAFEQLGVAQAAFEMAVNYAKERFAFGRAIGSFQAIKHKLVDVYVALELARSNCLFGGWALDNDAIELPVAAAAARVSASDAAWLATKENIQTHGGMGFTWEMDCHLYYRRAKALGLMLGSATEWKHRLIAGVSALDGDNSKIAFATGELQ